MGQIKSALEIALERTANIESDANAGKKRELENAGKRIASSFIDSGNEADLKKALSAYKNEEKNIVTEGIKSLLLLKVSLPQEQEEVDTIMRAGKALDLLYPHRHLNNLFDMIKNVLEQYFASQQQLEQALEQQYAPQLRKKEAELARQTGQQIHLSPRQDPEFNQLLERNIKKLHEQYSQAVEQAKQQIQEITG